MSVRIAHRSIVLFVGCCCLLFGTLASSIGAEPSSNWPKARPIDPEQLAKAGLRIVRSEHCTMVTDLPASAEVNGLPKLVDLGMASWAERFDLSKRQLDGWRVRVYLIKDRRRFDAQRLMPTQRDQFPDGFAFGYEVWLYDQPTDYYRRHLFLHEVTHSLMMTQLGSCGPGWYMEAMAELCGTHRWNALSEELRLATFPKSRQEAPYWGRVRLVRDAAKEKGIASIESLMKIDNRNALAVDAYAWLWALAKFMDEHPRYQKRWRSLINRVHDDRFDRRFRTLFRRDRAELNQEWQLFVSRIAYGYDIAGEAIDFQPGKPLTSGSHEVKVEAARGWQSSGVKVQAGQAYRIVGEGRCVIGCEKSLGEAPGEPWPCEAGGITLQYVEGRPLGQLLAAVVADDTELNTGVNAMNSGGFTDSTSVGLSARFVPNRSGTLYLRLNDAPNQLHDNQGSLSATISID